MYRICAKLNNLFGSVMNNLFLDFIGWIYIKDSPKAIDVNDIANQYIKIKQRKIKENYMISNKAASGFFSSKGTNKIYTNSEIVNRFTEYSLKNNDMDNNSITISLHCTPVNDNFNRTITQKK